MPKVLVSLLKKEVLDLLRDPKILIGMIVLPALLYPVMGAAMKASMTAAGRAAFQLPVAVLDLDDSQESNIIVSSLSEGGKIIKLEVDADRAVDEALEKGAGALVVIPDGFGRNLRAGEGGSMEIHVFFETGGFSTQIFASRIEQAVNSASEEISAHLVSLKTDLDPEAILNPLKPDYRSVFRGKVLKVPPQALAGALAGQMMATPMISIVVLIFAMQIAATSVAVEKEERTLETLLTIPTSRRNILLAKLIGSALVAGLGSTGIMGGLWYYQKMMGFAFETGAVANLVVVSSKDLALLAVSLMATNMLALTMATVLAVFTENVRSAQALVGNLYILIFIPAFMLMFADVKTLPSAARYALMAVPFTHLTLAAQNITWGYYRMYAVNLLYIIAWSACLILIANRIFSSEKILTARLKFKWRLRGRG
ncbi:MAG TPA: ABC transporter permease [Candidatus Korarchaeota archaeon]|nr:ABC transporter permease [Candidatus Korarchaeota archaeon]